MSHHMVELIPLFCHEPTNYTEVFARKRFLIHEIDTACIPESTEGYLIRGYRLSFCWMQAPCTHTRLGVKDSQNGSYSYLLFACMKHMAVAAMRHPSLSKTQSRFSQIVSLFSGFFRCADSSERACPRLKTVFLILFSHSSPSSTSNSVCAVSSVSSSAGSYGTALTSSV